MRRIEALLDERARQYLRYCTPTPKGASQDSTWMTMEATNWLGSNEKLFALVAEVAAKLAKKQR